MIFKKSTTVYAKSQEDAMNQIRKRFVNYTPISARFVGMRQGERLYLVYYRKKK